MESKIDIKINLIDSFAILPKMATDGSAAFDLYSSQLVILRKGRNKICTGIRLEMPKNIKANVRARSGFSLKGFECYNYVVDENGKYVVSAETTRIDADVELGLIDSDYRGEVCVIVNSHDDREFIVKAGSRIAQLEFLYVPPVQLIQVAELSDTERGNGGFGHTGTK